MRIATYNIWDSPAGMPARGALLLAELTALNADVLCLQEVPDRAAHDHLCETCGYPFEVFHAHSDETEGLSILSRYPMSQMEYASNCLFATLAAEGRTVCLANVHLPWDSPLAREKSIVDIVARLRATLTDHALLAGDFNCSEYSSVNRYLLGETTLHGADPGPCWYDLAAAYAQRQGTQPEMTLDIQHNPRWQGQMSVEISQRYDRLLVRNPYPQAMPELLKCEVFGRSVLPECGYAASDHYGVYADIRFPNQ